MFHTADIAEQDVLLNEVARIIYARTLRTTFAESCGTINASNLRHPVAPRELTGQG